MGVNTINRKFKEYIIENNGILELDSSMVIRVFFHLKLCENRKMISEALCNPHCVDVVNDIFYGYG